MVVIDSWVKVEGSPGWECISLEFSGNVLEDVCSRDSRGLSSRSSVLLTKLILIRLNEIFVGSFGVVKSGTSTVFCSAVS